MYPELKSSLNLKRIPHIIFCCFMMNFSSILEQFDISDESILTSSARFLAVSYSQLPQLT
jgi:hypothetical protein